MIKSLPWPKEVGRQDGEFKLERIENALAFLGNPEAKIPFPIHVVGTNGKGSTSAFLKSILEASGFTCHVYTSPNLICLNERIYLAGKQIEDETLMKYMEQTKSLLPLHLQEELSFFEGFTAAAFLAFANEKADFTIIEAGLGGRFDATNVINSKICVLTSVSFDHTEYLGETIEKIAKEKLAVQKNNCPFVISFQPYKEVYEIAKTIPNALIYERDFKIENEFYQSSEGTFKVARPSLLGFHQFYNAANAIKVCEVLNKNYNFEISNLQINKGLEGAKWPARLERLNTNFNNLEVYLDGAHNENGIEVLLKEIESWQKNVTIICGFLKRKDLTKIIPKFLNFSGKIFTCSINSSQESRSALELKEEFEKYNIKVQGAEENFANILQKLNQNILQQTVVILGSLYLAGQVLEWQSNNA